MCLLPSYIIIYLGSRGAGGSGGSAGCNGVAGNDGNFTIHVQTQNGLELASTRYELKVGNVGIMDQHSYAIIEPGCLAYVKVG